MNILETLNYCCDQWQARTGNVACDNCPHKTKCLELYDGEGKASRKQLMSFLLEVIKSRKAIP